MSEPRRVLSKRVLEQCRSGIRADLVTLGQLITASNGLPTASVGIKVWVLPPWYYSLYVRNRRFRLAVVDFLALTVKWPRVQLVGELEGPFGTASSNTTWNVGKGMLSESIAKASHPDGKERGSIIIHERDWRVGIEALPREQFLKEPPEIRLGRTQQDFASLRKVYGSAVSKGLIVRSNEPPIGCITVHTPRGSAWSDEVCDKILRTLAESALPVEVVKNLAYRIPPEIPT